ncbi:MAG: hypothetical protein HQL32_17885 [Planctomycetes bacterium]|nr:hypothetical protein [Planctomycetota bacterium]
MSQKNNKKIHLNFWALLTIALALLASQTISGWSNEVLGFTVKEPKIFFNSTVTGSIYFLLMYFCILSRLLLSTNVRFIKAIVSLVFILMLLGLGSFIAYIYLSSADQETLTGFGLDTTILTDSFNGVLSLIPAVGLIMVLTPILIPARHLSELASLYKKDFNTGFSHIDDYLNEQVQGKDQGEDFYPDVLLVEDDLSCASLALKFCNKLKLECVHVESLGEAEECLDRYMGSLRLLLLDNFVRIDDRCKSGCKTGSEWAKLLNEQYPRDKRRFSIAILSGHTHMFKELAEEADVVLQKPWDPRELFKYLKANHVI